MGTKKNMCSTAERKSSKIPARAKEYKIPIAYQKTEPYKERLYRKTIAKMEAVKLDLPIKRKNEK